MKKLLFLPLSFLFLVTQAQKTVTTKTITTVTDKDGKVERADSSIISTTVIPEKDIQVVTPLYLDTCIGSPVEPPAQPPAQGELPSIYGTLTFQNGYDSPSDVNTGQGARNTVSTTIKRSGPGSFRSEVRASDQSQSSGYRGEMQYNSSDANPVEGVVEYDVYYENWKNFGGGGHSFQWHPDNGEGSATLCLYSYSGKFQVVRNWDGKKGGVNYYQSGTLQTITPNKWYTLRWEFKWSNGMDGYVRLYIDNKLYYDYVGRTTSDNTGIPYLKVGQNRWSMPAGTNTVVYYDNLKVWKR